MFHIEYRVPGYDAVQVERFDNLRQAEAKYDELAGNTDITGLTQPFDPSERGTEPAPTASVSVSVEFDPGESNVVD